MKYFVYFSNSGNGDFLASLLKEKGYKLVKVNTRKPLGKMGFFKILHYGFKAMLNKKEIIIISFIKLLVWPRRLELP